MSGLAAAKPGLFVAVVGPSGAGKDSILRGAAAHFSNAPEVHFARRIVTRSANCDEDHDSVTEAEFDTMTAAGAFAVHWQAHGLHYGISNHVHDRLNEGGIVIANASRAICPHIKALFVHCLIVHITASEHILSQRLALRGREESNQREGRLARSKALEQAFEADIRIENNGSLDEAIQQFVQAVLALKPAPIQS
jgi:ribose 1,5-bisphosphokinase